MNLLVMDLSIRIAVAANRRDSFPGESENRQGISQSLQRFAVNLSYKGKKAKGRRTFSFCLLFLSHPKGTVLRSQH
jgi:hypothetical protein